MKISHFYVFKLYNLIYLIYTFDCYSNVISDIGDKKECIINNSDSEFCEIDQYVGSTVIYEDQNVRIWNFTLLPGEMTSMHRHEYDYYFVAIQPTQLEVYNQYNQRLFDFRAEGTLGFHIDGDYLIPNNIILPFAVPRIHAARNIGKNIYHEILYENKLSKAYYQNEL